MFDENLAASCGLYCGACEYLKNKCQQCEGCGYVKGKPFWTTQMKIEICPLYDCCINKKKVEHCGLCEKLPCDLFNEFYDPALSPEEAEQSIQKRLNDLFKRKEIGTQEWLREKGGK